MAEFIATRTFQYAVATFALLLGSHAARAGSPIEAASQRLLHAPQATTVNLASQHIPSRMNCAECAAFALQDARPADHATADHETVALASAETPPQYLKGQKSVLATPSSVERLETIEGEEILLGEGEYLSEGYHPEFSTRSCYPGCPSVWYADADFLFLSLTGSDRTTLSNNFFLSAFDFEPGARLTVGYRRDCLDGWEFTYLGPFQWEEQGELAGDLLSTNIVADGVDLSAFNQAVFHRQRREAQFHSVELTRRWWGWDVISTAVSLRYLYLDEGYLFESTNGAGEDGALGLDTENHLFGLQYGIDLRQPIGPRFAMESDLKLGVYGNAATGAISVINDGAVELDNESDQAQLGFVGQWRLQTSYRVLPRLTVRAGYEFIYIYGVAQATEQLISPLSAATLTDLDTENDLFLHAGSLGVELSW